MTQQEPCHPQLTVVMYHYVRPLAHSAYPDLKALKLRDFLGQLDWLARHYFMISPQDLAAALHSGARLPPRPCLLTFDDGYSDHFQHVFPALQARGLKGLFFAPSTSLLGGRVLEVNKIQFVLASRDQPCGLADQLDALLSREGLADPAALRAAHCPPNRFDTANVAYVKPLLQYVLPAPARSFAIDALFRQHVTADEAGFAQTLYLTPDQAVEMRGGGIEFGGHGDLHLWHGQCAPADLQGEITGSVRALERIGAPVRGGFYCYPFGDQTNAVRAAVNLARFRTGFTVQAALCDPSTVDPLQILRLRTPALPCYPQGPSSPRREETKICEAVE